MLAVKGGKVVTVTGETLENGTILTENGKIKEIGHTADIQIPHNAEIIDASGKWVTPGFIDAHTHISTFSEPMTMPGIHDGNEASSPVTAHIRAIDALNPHDIAIKNTRRAGFTTCYTGPGSANVIGGTGIAIKLKDSDTVFDIIIEGTEQMKMALGENPRRFYGTQHKMPMTRMGVGAVLRETLYNAKVYSDQLKEAETDSSKGPKPDFKLEALVPVIRGKMKCRIHAHRADDIITAVRICKEYHLDFSIEHCTEGYKIANFLKENNVDCVVGPMTSFGLTKMELWGRKLENPKLLEAAGVKICLTEDSQSGTQYLPIFLGLAIARGLSEKTALEGITINPAKLLGIEDKIGSLETGKDADIAIFDGNPFSNFTLCEKTIIEGVVYNNLEH